MKRLLLILLFSAPVWGQAAGNVTMVLFPGAPSGTCNSRQIALNQSSGQLFTCNAGAWQAIQGGGGGGLNGCTTAVTGQLICNVSVQGGTGLVGVLLLPYDSSGLPTPPSGANAGIAANASGQLFWSPGNSTAYSAIGGGGGGGGTVMNFSATGLLPLFSTNVINSTTYPTLSFTAGTAPANTVWGNLQSTAGSASWVSTSSLGGGGGGGPLGGVTIVQ